MICIKCNINKISEDFYFYPNKNLKKSVCKECDIKQRREIYLEEATEKKAVTMERMKKLLAEIIDSCECRNSRRLKLCIEKAKIEVGGRYSRKNTNEN